MRPAPSSASTLGWLAFAFAFLAAFFISTAVPTRLLWYDPLAHRFLFALRPGGIAMDFYGRVLLCLACGGAGLLLSRLLFRQVPSLLRAEVGYGLVIWITGLLLFTGGLYVSLLQHRVPMPAPLPSAGAGRPHAAASGCAGPPGASDRPLRRGPRPLVPAGRAFCGLLLAGLSPAPPAL